MSGDDATVGHRADPTRVFTGPGSGGRTPGDPPGGGPYDPERDPWSRAHRWLIAIVAGVIAVVVALAVVLMFDDEDDRPTTTTSTQPTTSSSNAPETQPTAPPPTEVTSSTPPTLLPPIIDLTTSTSMP